MALPVDLRTLLWQQLPFNIVENFPAAVLRLWLAVAAPAVVVQRYEKTLLTDQEWYLKIASWSGFVGYTNQLFLPYGLPLLQAALHGNVPVFVDAFRRGSRHARAAIAALRQDPVTAENMLIYLLADGKGLDINIDELIDEMLLGRIVIPFTICQLLVRYYYESSEQTMTDMLMKQFTYGVEVALLGNYRIPRLDAEPYVFLLGYLLAGGRDFARLQPAIDDDTINYALTVLNLPEVAIPANDEQIAFSEIPYHMIAKMPKTGTRTFPNTNYEMDTHGYEVYLERAQHMLPLIEEVYEPSPQRDRYRDYLRLLLTPTLPATELQHIPAHDYDFLTLIGRFDLMDRAPSDNPDFHNSEQLQRMRRPELLLPIVGASENEINLSHVLSAVLSQAAMQGRFPIVAAFYFSELPYTIRRTHLIMDRSHAILDLLRDIYYAIKPVDEMVDIWNNSFLLQWVKPELTIEEKPSARQLLSSLPFFRFIYLSRRLVEFVNAYDYATWRLVLPELPDLALADPIMQNVEKYRIRR